MSSTDLKKFNNAGFQTGASFVTRVFWYFCNAVFFNSWFHFYPVKNFLLKLFGANIARGVIIKPRVNIKYPWNLSIGENSWIGEGVWLDSLGKISIGNNCCISQGAMLITGNHNYKKTSFDLIVKEIVLEDGVWIGAGSIVCPGIVCRTHAVLMTGSVASHDLEPYCIYRGNPAEKIKERIISET